MNLKEKLEIVVEACEDRKAENCVVLNMQHVTPVTDYFVICHGNNERQVQAIARSVKESLEEKGHEIKRIEGFEQARWILIDIGDIICHIFHKDERTYYNLERLWGDASEVSIGDNS
ncbi:ribosome silencing factor [Pseudogracilibacillus sp. SE30717A]|uniref:ribosome silencing factor n=1 Tax=Pseudogracilibacillus sp. SE30717A TaxID=3098293 RepID=UPI00300DE579